MKKTIRDSFVASIPVLAGYIFLGIAFGLLANSKGLSVFLTFAMSLFIYAGSMQFVAVDFLTGAPVSLITVILSTVMVNARHIFYGISMIDRYKNAGAKKPYLIFALTDETYSLVCQKYTGDAKHEYDYYFFVSLLIGAVLGEILPFSISGIDFALTALFVTVFCDQWFSSSSHFASVTGVLASVICLLIFGAENFLIPSMIVILAVLSIFRKKADKNE